jgi:hypothetical protein
MDKDDPNDVSMETQRVLVEEMSNKQKVKSVGIKYGGRQMMRKVVITSAVVLMAGIMLAHGQPPSLPSGGKPSAERLSELRRMGGPARLLCATSEDGLTWTKNDKVVVNNAVSPGALFDGQTIRLYFFRSMGPAAEEPTLVFVMLSRDGAAWEEKQVDVSGLPDGMCVEDPSVVLTPQGKYRMYYYEHPYREGRPLSRTGRFTIASAISNDGINFQKEAGVRFEYGRVMDPDVIQMGNVWRMFCSEDGRIVSAISHDNGQGFAFEKYVPLDGFITATVKVPGGYRMYYQSRAYKGKPREIFSAFSADGEKWTKDAGVRIKGEVRGHESGGLGDVMSMAVAKTDTGYWMFYVSKSNDSKRPRLRKQK